MRTLLVMLAVLAPLSARAALPEDDGPFVALTEVDTIQAGPAQVKATVCLPQNATGPRPLMALATSLLEPRDVLGGLCLHYASYGFIAVVPDLGYANTDAASIGQTLLDALAFLQREGARSGSRFEGRVDGAHRGVLGFNTGAMGALQAAAIDDTLSVAVLLDPLDINGQARAAAANVQHVPVMVVAADPGQCNANGGSPAIYGELSGPRSTVHVDYATDCDAEWPASQNCQATCGNSHEYAFKYVRRFATAYAGLFVGCLDGMRTHVSGSALDELVAARLVDHVDQQELPQSCGPYAATDAGAPSADAGAPPTSGCSSTGSAPLGVMGALAVALLLGLARRR